MVLEPHGSFGNFVKKNCQVVTLYNQGPRPKKLNYKVNIIFVGPLQRVRPRNGILGLVLVLVVLVVLPLRSEFIGEL